MTSISESLLSKEFLQRLRFRGETHNHRAGYAIAHGWVIISCDGNDEAAVDWAKTEQEAEQKVKAFYQQDAECELPENLPKKSKSTSKKAKKPGRLGKSLSSRSTASLSESPG